MGLLTLALVCAGFAHDRATALDNVTLITDFGFNGRHAYFFVALDKGYYKDADLDVKIVRGQGSVDAIRQVGANNAIVGFADAGSLVLARGNDQIPVKLVAIVYAKPPQAIFCREDSGLKQPKDLEGAFDRQSGRRRDRGHVPGLSPRRPASMPARSNGSSRAATRFPDCSPPATVPCVGQFTVGEPLLRAQAGAGQARALRLLRMPGVSFYGNGIVATDTTIATKPDLVRRFVAATIRGMKDAFANPEEAGAIMHKYHPARSTSRSPRAKREAVAELAQVPGQELGMIDPARIDETIDVVKSVFKLKTPVTVNDVYAPGSCPSRTTALVSLRKSSRAALPASRSPISFPTRTFRRSPRSRSASSPRKGLTLPTSSFSPTTRPMKRCATARSISSPAPAHVALAAFPQWRGAKFLAALAQGMYWLLVLRADLDGNAWRR